MTGIGACDENPCQRVAQPVADRAFSHAVITWVGSQQGWEHSTGHHVADRLIREARPIPLGVTLRALAEWRICVFRLMNAGDYADNHELVRIKSALGCDLEFSLPGERRNPCTTFDCEVVGHHAKNAVVFLRRLIRE